MSVCVCVISIVCIVLFFSNQTSSPLPSCKTMRVLPLKSETRQNYPILCGIIILVTLFRNCHMPYHIMIKRYTCLKKYGRILIIGDKTVNLEGLKEMTINVRNQRTSGGYLQLCLCPMSHVPCNKTSLLPA